MTGAEVRALKDEEISVELDRLRGSLLSLKSKSVTEKIEDSSSFGKIRKDIARLQTERRARQMSKES
jgi:large subunit ribosomal protein L29